MSWSPPYIEALMDFGVKFDFSSNISLSESFKYKGINFLPYTFIQHWYGTRLDYQCLASSLLKRKISIFDLHPTLYVNKIIWDSIYYNGNPENLERVPERTAKEANNHFGRFELFVKQIATLRKLKLIEITSELKEASSDLIIDRDEIRRVYEASMRWPKRYFNFSPRYSNRHFEQFFEDACK